MGGNLEWVKQIGAGSSYPAGGAIAVDNMGDIYITGYFTGIQQFNGATLTSAGLSDIKIMKLDGNGTLLSIKQAGGSSDETGSSIAVDQRGNCYVVGGFEGTAAFDDT